MAKFRVAGNAEVKVDDSNGTLRNLSSYVDTISLVGKEYQSLDVTALTNTAENIIVGIESSTELTLQGHADDTATTGPDAVLAPLVGTKGTIEWYPIGTASGRRKMNGEYLCISYKLGGAVKGRVEWTSVHKLDGTLTVGTV